MNRVQQKPVGGGPGGTKVQPAPCSMIGSGPCLTQQLPVREQMHGGFKTPNVAQAAPAEREISDLLLPDQMKPLTSSASMTSISRPRPTVLGTKPSTKTSRTNQEIQLIPVCIPAPQTATVPTHSPTDSASIPQNLRSPQSSSSKPYLSPTSSLSPRSTLGSEQACTTLSGVSAQSEKSSENSDFR